MREKHLHLMETWDERYAAGRFASDAPHKLLVALCEQLPAGRALDLACGAGRNANFLAAKGWQVTAVDSSRVGVELARQRAEAKGVTVDYCVADLEQGGFPIAAGEYDLICDFYYLQHDLFPAMKTGVRAGGLIVAAIHIYGAGEEPGRFTLREGELCVIFNVCNILHYYETALTDTDTGEHHRRTAEIIAQRT
jgi:SAM-dependent methyltransferase